MGRNRKANAKRWPSGQVRYDKPQPHRQRLNDLARLLQDPRLASPLGHMLYGKAITQEQHDAGMAYREAREAADRALGLPARQPRGQDLSAVHGLGMGDDDELARERRERCDKRLMAMEAAIGDDLTLSVVQRVVLYELVPAGAVEVMTLVGGLTRLAAWRKVTGGRK